MPYAVLEKQLKELPEEYLEDVFRYVQLLQYKITVLEQNKKDGKTNGIIFGLGKGVFSVPEDINAGDDAVSEIFGEYV